MSLDLNTHPCFSPQARHEYRRVHLPVAPACNVQCNFCNRQYDCANESRPGVTSAVLSPYQALAYLQKVIKLMPRLSVVGIAGPGDPFANAEKTLQTLRLIRQHHPDLLLCVASNGLNITPYVPELARLQVSHVTLTVNAVDPAIGAKIYAWIRVGQRPYRGEEAGRFLRERQWEAIRALKAAGLTVKINTILIPGVNNAHIDEVARVVKEAGADIHNLIPLYSVAGTPFAEVPPPSTEMTAAAREVSARYLPQMAHCARCRADAAGLLSEPMNQAALQLLRESAALPLRPDEDRPCLAVASREGMLVNLHLGEAEMFLIYKTGGGCAYKVETRRAPQSGLGRQRWYELADLLHDCRAVLVSGAGESPRQVLEEDGLAVLVTEGLVQERLAEVFAGRMPRPPVRAFSCGSGCRGGSGIACG